MDPEDVKIYGMLGFVCNPDGSITRQPELQPNIEPISAVDPSLVLTKDITINQSKSTWARIILPREVVELNSNNPILPLIVYFHGGGFALGHADTPNFQEFYRIIATEIPAAVISVEYRRPPEHRLPAAYEDCVEALHWIKNTNNELVNKYVDLSKCFLMGTSAGANLAYHVGLRCTDSIKPLEIQGLILHHAYFGGKERTKSEIKFRDDNIIPLRVNDLLWEMALPVGADRDHVYCNPTIEMESNPVMFDRVKNLGLKILVTGCDGDPLVDRQVEVMNKLESMGVRVVGVFDVGGHHGVEIADSFKAKELCVVIKDFIVAS